MFRMLGEKVELIRFIFTRKDGVGMEGITSFKGTVAVFAAVTGYLLDCFTELIVVLIILMMFDYITGVMAAFVKKELASKKGVQGILKKFGFMLMVVLGFLLDFVIITLIQKTGVNFSTGGLFGISTTCWLIGTESISIIENLGDIGVPIPKFLKDAFVKLRESAESITSDNVGVK